MVAFNAESEEEVLVARLGVRCHFHHNVDPSFVWLRSIVTARRDHSVRVR
jgi:hypothetical protein